MDTVCRPKN